MKIDFYDKKLNKTTKDLKVNVKDISEVNQELLAQYVRVYSNNQRQPNANVKTRAEVSGGGKKPWRQKGTGRARHGSIRSPLWVGGGVTHGPKNRNWKLRINKNMKKTLFKQVISNKISNKKIVLVDFSFLNAIKTKDAVASIFKITNNKDSKVLVVTNNDPIVVKSFENVRNVNTTSVSEINTLDLLVNDWVVLTTNSLDTFEKNVG